MSSASAQTAESTGTSIAAAPPSAASTTTSQTELITVTGGQTPAKTDLGKAPTSEIATTYSLNQADLQGLVTESTVDLIRSIPGVYGASFGIGGIANGMGLRGWAGNGDGNNIATYIDNYQRNNLSGGNSNGYDDLNPLIPETVGSLDLVKGPFSTRYGGPFAFAGSLIINTADLIPTGFSQEFGSFTESRSLATYGYQGTNFKFYTALEGYYLGGYRQNSTSDRINSFSKFTAPVGENGTLRLTFQIYQADYGQAIYPRLTNIQTGSTLQATNPDDYGNKSQVTATANYTLKEGDFNLDSNLFIDKSYVHRSATRDTNTNPDVSPLLQNIFKDDRWVFGGNVDPYWQFQLPQGVTAAIRTGLSFEDSSVTQDRFPGLDNLPVSQPNYVNAANQISGVTYWGDFNEINTAAYLEGEVKPVSWFKFTSSARYDYFNYNVDGIFPKGAALPVFNGAGALVTAGKPGTLVGESYDDYTGRLTGRGGAAILFNDYTTLYANIGQGVNPPAALADLQTNHSLKTIGMTSNETGLTYDNPEQGLHLSSDIYYTINNGELSSVGGIEENVGKSRRLGADVDGSVYVFRDNGNSLKLNASYSVVRARVVGNDAARYITGVPDYVASWGWDYNVPVNFLGTEGEDLRWTLQDQWIGAQKIIASGTLRAPEFSRINTKVAYDLPSYHNLEVYLGSIIYPGSTISECCSYTTVSGIPLVSVQPTFQAVAGLSVKF